jgi:hypothetical protein
MAKETITIPLETYKCLREHLIKANELFSSLSGGGSLKAPKTEPRENKKDKVNKYKSLITTGIRVKKPDHLKK